MSKKKGRKAPAPKGVKGQHPTTLDELMAADEDHEAKARKRRMNTNYDDPVGYCEWEVFYYDSQGREVRQQVPAAVMSRNHDDGSVRFTTQEGTVYWFGQSSGPVRYIARKVDMEQPVNHGGVALKTERVGLHS